MIFRVGVSRSLKRLRLVCEEMNAGMMISAGSLWDKKRGKFRSVNALKESNIVLDSAGYVAMSVHGGKYPWSWLQYLDLVEKLAPAWYASRDYCVEPSIASSQKEIDRRIHLTNNSYIKGLEISSKRGLPAPMPVLQGWNIKDYELSFSLMQQVPNLIGIGSVCRRPMYGSNGLSSILDFCATLNCKIHLFGVKGTALKKIRSDLLWSQLVYSVDSHAWDSGARRAGLKTLDQRMIFLKKWYFKQQCLKPLDLSPFYGRPAGAGKEPTDQGTLF